MANDWESDFVEFAQSQSQALYRTAYLLCGDAALAEDLVQTTLTKLYVAWPRLARRHELHGYARRVLGRCFIDETRRPWRRESPSEQPPEGGYDPHVSVDERDALLRAVRALPPRQRAVVVLRIWEELSVGEVARALKVSEGTVKSQHSRALRTLQTLLLAERSDTTIEEVNEA